MNKLKKNKHLFTYTLKKKKKPLIRIVFLIITKKYAILAEVNFNFGHNLKIGGTLEYFL